MHGVIDRMNMEKLRSKVTFSINDLSFTDNIPESRKSKFIDEKYNLIGISNHAGNCGGGHYYAFCRNPFDNLWYEHNDAMGPRLSPVWEQPSACKGSRFRPHSF